MASIVDRVRESRREVEGVRAIARPDVARELSIAITALEDAEMRLVRAEALATRRHPADAAGHADAQALGEKLLDPTVGTEEETGTQEVTPDGH